MKIIYLFLIMLFIIACSSNQELSMQEATESAENDSVTYELVVLDPGFETWFITHRKPQWYHSQSYYENWNQQYVNAWNYGNMGYRHKQLINCYIDYDNRTDYGLELNHKLFYYFQYVENRLNIPILAVGPRAGRY